MLNFRQIEVFRAIMLARTMSGAAKMLNASQPGLSRMIKHLESRLGFLLFDRVHGRLVPTAEAHTLFRELQHIHHGIENLDHVVARLAAGDNVVFRLGVSPSLSRGFAPGLLSELCRSHPNLIVQFDVLSVEQMSDYLITGRSEYGLSLYAVDHPNVGCERIGAVPLALVVPHDHRLAARSGVTMRELSGERLISFGPDTPHGRAIAEMAQRAGVAPDVSTRVRFAETACAFVAHGLGIALVDEQTARDAGFPNIRMVSLRDSVQMNVYLLRYQEAPRSKASTDFEASCRAHAAVRLKPRRR